MNELKSTNFTEMSDYIDLKMYHKYESQHPGYTDMILSIVDAIEKLAKKSKNVLQILEFGSGTGLATEKLANIPNVKVTAVEPDTNCFSSLKLHIENLGLKNVTPIQDDGVEFLGENKFDVVITVFAHHHISPTKSDKFVKNIYNNLKPKGVYIVGDELTADYTNEEERKSALRKYHHHIINLAEDEDHFELAKLEYGALYSGIRKIGDYKRSIRLLENEMIKDGFFKIAKKIRIFLKKQPKLKAGIYIYKFNKI